MPDFLSLKSTKEVPVSKLLMEQIIGQEKAVELIRKAAIQKRNVLLIGIPGTGKSMLAKAMSELMPLQRLTDVLIYPNEEDQNNPKVREVRAGEGKKILEQSRLEAKAQEDNLRLLGLILPLGWFILSYFLWSFGFMPDVVYAATLILGGFLMIGFALGSQVKARSGTVVPKLLVNNEGKKTAPFFEATGARAGALLGDVRHDPLQCILPDQLVSLPNGKPMEAGKMLDGFFHGFEGDEKELSDKESFEVLSGAGDKFCYAPARVTKVFRRKFWGDIIEFRTRKGYSLKVTPNHPVAVFHDGGAIGFVRAEEIKKGAFSIVPERLPISAGKPLSKEQVVVLADILADGHIGKRNVQFKLRKDYKIRKIEEDLKKARLNFTERADGKNTRIDVNSAQLVRWLKDIGALSYGKKSVPSALFDQPKHLIELFIINYLSLDGYANRTGQFELLSKELIPDFVPLLLKVGLKSNYRPRLDTGFKKGNLQPRIIFQDISFAKKYFGMTKNEVHRRNLKNYVSKTSFHHVTFDDIIPIGFSMLEKFRLKTGLSKNRIHEAYYALNQSVGTAKKPTRQFLQEVVSAFTDITNDPGLFRLRDVVQGTFSYDEIIEVKKKPYSGFVYNMATSTGTYLVNNVLTHNSGGLGTPAHLRVEPGMIHKASGGVLFVDEIATLSMKSQQELLTAMQEKKYSITGQSEMSSGAMTRTDPIACNFVLVAAGNYNDLEKVHPALRSRIRGYGYEAYMNLDMDDNGENSNKIVQFVAQEVAKDGKIPHFGMDAVKEIVFEARRRSGRKSKLTLKLRDLGGLVRAAGDIAKEKNHRLVTAQDVLEAKMSARTLEQQMVSKMIDERKEYDVYLFEGSAVGRVNGLAVLADGDAGLVMPIEAEVAPAQSRSEGKLIATGKLGEIAREAVQNVSAIIKRLSGKDVFRHDIHIQFLQSYSGVEGDSASVSVATAVVSALEGIPVKQNLAMTGSLSVRGEVMPVGGVSAKVSAAIAAGFREVIIPHSNLGDVVLSKEKLEKVKLIPVKTLSDVLESAFVKSKRKTKLLASLKKIMKLTLPRISESEVKSKIVGPTP